MDKVKHGFFPGVWDLLHPGHVSSLEYARERCEYLTVGLQTNPANDRPDKNKPIETVAERTIRLRAVKWVDGIIVYDNEEDLQNVYASMPISAVFMGMEYQQTMDTALFITGRDILEQRDISIYFVPRFHNWSSTALRKKICSSVNI